MIEVELKTTDPETVAFISMRGPYAQIPQAMGQLYGWVAQHGLQPIGMPRGVYMTAPGTAPEEEAVWELQAGVAGDPSDLAADDSGCGIKHLSPQLVASATYRGPYEEIGPAYEELGAWISANGYSVVAPPEEVYVSDPNTTPVEETLTEIRFPIAKR